MAAVILDDRSYLAGIDLDSFRPSWFLQTKIPNFKNQLLFTTKTADSKIVGKTEPALLLSVGLDGGIAAFPPDGAPAIPTLILDEQIEVVTSSTKLAPADQV